MGFDPFGRADQARFLAVPARINQRALWFPSLLDERADRLDLRHQRDVGRKRVPGAKHPGIMVISTNQPLVGKFAAFDRRNDIVDWLESPVGGDAEVRARGARADVIGDGQGTAPGWGRHRPLQRREQRLRVGR